MKANSGMNNNSNSDLEESIKNEEYLLGFGSQYKTELYKDEELEAKNKEKHNEQINKDKKGSSDSTTNSLSQEHNNISEINFKRKRDLSRDDIFDYKEDLFDFYDKSRKMSSPLCDYLNGSDQYLSKFFKSTVDIKSSQNFVKKVEFFNGEKPLNNINNKNKNNLTGKNKINLNSINNNIEIEKFKNYNSSSIPFSNINNNQFINNNNANNINNCNNNYNNNYINYNLYFLNNNYPNQQIFNINYINLNNYPNNNNNFNRRKLSYNIEANLIGNYFNNILNQNHPQLSIQEPNFIQLQNQQKFNPLFSINDSPTNYQNSTNKNNSKKNNPNSKMPKKPLDKRKGDWQCPKCNNLNFAFRVKCNRCQLQKPNN